MVSKETSEKVLTIEDSQLRDYEMVVVISPDLADETLDTAIADLNQFITGKDGVISEVEQWGKKRLAYPIGRFVEGNYVLMRFKLKPELSRELEANLQISEVILRHLLIRTE